MSEIHLVKKTINLYENTNIIVSLWAYRPIIINEYE